MGATREGPDMTAQVESNTPVELLWPDKIVFRPLVGRSPLIIFMATVGFAYILEGGAQIIWGTQPRGLKLPIPLDPLRLRFEHI